MRSLCKSAEIFLFLQTVVTKGAKIFYAVGTNSHNRKKATNMSKERARKRAKDNAAKLAKKRAAKKADNSEQQAQGGRFANEQETFKGPGGNNRSGGFGGPAKRGSARSG